MSVRLHHPYYDPGKPTEFFTRLSSDSLVSRARRVSFNGRRSLIDFQDKAVRATLRENGINYFIKPRMIGSCTGGRREAYGKFHVHFDRHEDLMFFLLRFDGLVE